MAPEEVRKFLSNQDSARFKEISTDLLYDVMLVQGEDAVLVRLASPYPSDIVLMSLVDFVNLFEEYWGPQPD